nr:MAG TPA: hypothetical protein [Caudoviricetes sp.]
MLCLVVDRFYVVKFKTLQKILQQLTLMNYNHIIVLVLVK